MISMTARAIAFGILLAAAGAALGARAEGIADIGGTWSVALRFDKGKDTLELSVQQKSNDIKGTLASKAFGQRTLSGRVADDRVTLAVEAERHGKPSTLTFTGRLDGAEAMSGTATWSGEKAAFGRWTATKKR